MNNTSEIGIIYMDDNRSKATILSKEVLVSKRLEPGKSLASSFKSQYFADLNLEITINGISADADLRRKLIDFVTVAPPKEPFHLPDIPLEAAVHVIVARFKPKCIALKETDITQNREKAKSPSEFECEPVTDDGHSKYESSADEATKSSTTGDGSVPPDQDESSPEYLYGKPEFYL